MSCLPALSFKHNVMPQTISWEGVHLDVNKEKGFFITWNSYRSEIQIWDYSKGELIRIVDSKVSIKSISLHDKSNKAIIGTADNKVIVFDLFESNKLFEINTIKQELYKVQALNDVFTVAALDGSHVFNFKGELVDFYKMPSNGTFFNNGFLDAEASIYLNTNEGSFELTNVTTQESVNIESKKIKKETIMIPVDEFLFKTTNRKKYEVYFLNKNDLKKSKYLYTLKVPSDAGNISFLQPLKVKGELFFVGNNNEGEFIMLNGKDFSVKRRFNLKSNRVFDRSLLENEVILRNKNNKSFEIFDLRDLSIRTLAKSINPHLTGGIVLSNRYLIQGDEDGNLMKWDLKLGILKSKIKAHESKIVSVQKIDEFRYVSVGELGVVKEWHIIKPTPIDELSLGYVVSSFSLSEDNKSIAYCVKNYNKVMKLNLSEKTEFKFSKYDLRYPNGFSTEDPIGDLDYASPISFLERLEEKKFAFTVGNYYQPDKLIIADWSGTSPREIKKVVLNDNEYIEDFIIDRFNKSIALLVQSFFDESRVVTYSFSGYKKNEFKSEEKISSITINEKTKKLNFTIGGNRQVYELDNYGKKSNTKLILSHAPKQIIQCSEYIVCPTKDGITLLIDKASGDELLSIYNFSSAEDWLIIDKEGRFDGTENSYEKVKVSDGYTTRKIGSFFNVYFTPNLLSKYVNNIELSPLKKVDQSITQPKINIVSNTEIESFDKNLTWTVSISGNGYPLNSLKIFQNGKITQSLFLGSVKDTVLDVHLTLNSAFGENNYFYAIVDNTSNIQSDKLTKIVKYKGASDDKPDLYVFSIGVNIYDNPKYNLSYAVNDAVAISNKLEEINSGVYENIHLKILQNQEVTRINIEKVFNELRNEMRENDVFVFYYAGHGVTYEVQNKPDEFYLVTKDVKQIYGAYNEVKKLAVSSSQLQEFSSSINSQKQLFIIDACHSGGALETFAARGQREEQVLARLARSTGTYWITASNSTETAAEVSSDKHGAFTYTLLKAMESDSLTVRSLSTYVETNLPEYTMEKTGKPQYPMAYGFGHDFPISK